MSAFVALALGFGAWLAVAWLLSVVYRPRRPAEARATTELRDDPPAVVNLLTHGWTVTPAAVPATIVDLAQRGVLDIVQRSPAEDVIELRRTLPGNLRPYERLVINHLRRAASNATVPMRAMLTGPESATDDWWRRFRATVARDARRRGLSRPRTPWVVVAGMAVALALLVVRLVLTVRDSLSDVPVGVIVFVSVVGAAAVYVALRWPVTAQRDTANGLAAASHWRAVRQAYVTSGDFDTVSPAAVIVLGRHLAYATAMDVARHAVDRLPLGEEDDALAWAVDPDGRARLVTVRYPWRRAGWGMRPEHALVTGLAWTATLAIPVYVVGWWWSDLLERLQRWAALFGDSDDPSTRLYDMTTADRMGGAAMALIAVGLGLIAVNGWYRGVLRMIRALADEGRYQTVRGVVIRRRTWPDDAVERHYVAVDNGVARRIRAVRVRPALGGQIHQGDEVELRVSQYLGHVRKATVVKQAEPVPPPTAIATIGAPHLLPPMHWSERLPALPNGTPAGAYDPPPGMPEPVAAVVRQLARVIAR